MNSRTLSARIRRLRLLLLDVDGILTDGRIYLGPGGAEFKAFHVHDGLGIKRLREAGIEVGFLSSRSSAPVTRRARELGVKIVLTGVPDKVRACAGLKGRLKLKDEEIGFAGDDLPDLALLKKVGVAFTVPGAPPEIRRAAHYLTRRRGGEGAVREIADLILRLRAPARRK